MKEMVKTLCENSLHILNINIIKLNVMCERVKKKINYFM